MDRGYHALSLLNVFVKTKLFRKMFIQLLLFCFCLSLTTFTMAWRNKSLIYHHTLQPLMFPGYIQPDAPAHIVVPHVTHIIGVMKNHLLSLHTVAMMAINHIIKPGSNMRIGQ